MTPTRAVVGTAGHVDHGKTELVRALTGSPGDRLPEEKRRGITIELGFARWDVPGFSVSVIDVPGHERFVATMVAGAAGIDAVILVVAADDGVMPQTREHLLICSQLGITRGVIAITKVDLADASTLALVEEDVRETVRSTFLEHAEVVRTSAKMGLGLDALTAAMQRVLASGLRATSKDGPAWLPIDRVFSKHGHGTVVTGTLVKGAIAVGDTLELLAGETMTKVVVRGLSVHGGEVTRASAPTRLALNLRGIEPTAAPRGAVLTTPGSQIPTRSLDVVLQALDEEPRFGARTELALHLGATQVNVRARTLGPMDAQHAGIVRLTSETPFATYAGDRFVLRRPELARDRTIGGGEVLDPHPTLPRPKKRSEPFARTIALDPRARVLAMVGERAGGATRRELTRRLPPDVRLAPVVDALVREGTLVEVQDTDGARWVAAREIPRAKSAVRSALVAFHQTHPAAAGASIAELAGGVPPPWRPLVPIAAAALVREGAIAGGDRMAAIGHDAHALADQVAALYARAGLAAITDEAARAECGLPERTFRDVVTELVRVERIVRIATGVYVDREALEALVVRVGAWLDEHDSLSPGDFKTLTGLTRKNAIAILEWLDRRGVTRRKGETRVRA